MALRGTLKDFGIADIFQLIGHQGKTGALTVKNRDQIVEIFFLDGNVVRAETENRKKRDLFGNMLVRAEAVTEERLKKALSTQKRTLRRLGELLLEQGDIDEDTLRVFARLQSTETIYALFLWDAGTYEFKNTKVELDPGAETIRSESILMEGFRQVDEWPTIRRSIKGYGICYRRIEDLNAMSTEVSGDTQDDIDLDDAFGDFDLGGNSETGEQRLENIDENERFVYSLIADDRDVQKLIDLSRLGEFETCKALVNLLDAKIIESIASKANKSPSSASLVGGITSRHRERARLPLHLMLLVVVLIGVVLAVDTSGLGPGEALQHLRVQYGFVEQDLLDSMSRGHLQELRLALEMYRARTGSYPSRLSRLVEVDLISPADLRQPWRERYGYRLTETGYALSRPLR